MGLRRGDLSALFEELASLEHKRWAHWQSYMHEKGERQADGSINLPAHLVQRWDHQINTPYASLSEEEKESDREQVRQYFPLIEELVRPSQFGD